MKLPGRWFSGPSEGRSIRFDIMVRFLAVALLADVILTAVLLLAALAVSGGPAGRILEEKTGIEVLSPGFFLLLGVIFAAGAAASVIAALVMGLPFGRMVRTSLLDIRDANEIFSRGKLDFRLDLKGYVELTQIAEQFNRMAQRMEKQVESLQRLVNEKQDLLEGAEEAASAEERRKIARELHDAVSQQLFAVSTTLAAVPVLMESDPGEAKRYLSLIGKMVEDAQQELRALIMHLRPVSLEGRCLREGIGRLLDGISEKGGDLRILRDLQDVEGVPPGIENNIFRVIQEAISNILRHAKATSFTVKLYQKGKVMVLIIEDNGIGIGAEDVKKTSYGIETMRERVEEVGGRFDLISYPGKGTRIEIRIPVGLQGIFK